MQLFGHEIIAIIVGFVWGVWIGFGIVAAGTLLRLTCYRYLGTLFTFDLTLFPKHTLVTAGPYGFVRHPAYLGSLLVFLGDLIPIMPSQCFSSV